jgi:hypothetical protein
LPFDFLIEQRAYEKSNWRRHGGEDEVERDKEMEMLTTKVNKV